MRTFRGFAAVLAVFLSVSLFAGEARADATNEELLKRLDALEQEVKILKRQLEVKKEDEDKKKTEAPVITASNKDGFSIKSPDDNFKLRIRGLLQTDARIFVDNKKDVGTTDTFLVRRARPIFEGTVYKNFNFYLVPDFGNSTAALVDGYVEYVHQPELRLRAGKFKEPFGLERLQSDVAANFTEAGLTSNLVPNRDTGVMLHGDLWGESVYYSAAIFNGSADGAGNTATDLDTNNDKDAVLRIFTHPFKHGDNEAVRGLGLGFASTFGHQENAAAPAFRSPGQVSVFTFNSGVTADGTHYRYSPQAYWYWNQFGVLAEYVSSTQELVRGALREKFFNDAWQVSGTYVLTGEDASYKGVKPRKPFDLSQNQWGAFEIAGRYGELDLDDDLFQKGFASLSNSISGQKAFGLGLNWYLNNAVRLTLDYEHTTFDDGLINGEDRKAENAVFTRFQLQY